MEERGRRRQRDQEQKSENKENVAEDKEAEMFALPPPRTPVPSKRNPRSIKNVLTTPNQNVSANKPNTPRGKMSFCSILRIFLFFSLRFILTSLFLKRKD